jgi:cytosine deaminase
MEAILPLRDAYAWAINLQICVFPQEGLFTAPETEALMREALAMGADFHLDTFDEARDLSIFHVAALTVKQGWQGRVCAGHMTALGALEPADLVPIAAMIRDAGISVLALPATDLYLMGRSDTRNVRRGLAPVRRLAEAGVNVAVSTNNVQNPFTPWGDADLLRMANLLATVAHLGTVEDLSLALRMATDNAARAIRLRDYGLMEGARRTWYCSTAASRPKLVPPSRNVSM